MLACQTSGSHTCGAPCDRGAQGGERGFREDGEEGEGGGEEGERGGEEGMQGRMRRGGEREGEGEMEGAGGEGTGEEGEGVAVWREDEGAGTGRVSLTLLLEDLLEEGVLAVEVSEKRVEIICLCGGGKNPTLGLRRQRQRQQQCQHCSQPYHCRAHPGLFVHATLSQPCRCLAHPGLFVHPTLSPCTYAAVAIPSTFPYP